MTQLQPYILRSAGVAETRKSRAVPQTRRGPFRICQVLHSLGVGGAELLARSIGTGLSEHFQFVFACLDGLGEVGRDLERLGYEVRVIGRRAGIDFGCARRLSAFLAAQNVDLVHAHQYTPFFYSCLARFGGGGRPILFTEHGRHHPDQPSLKRRWFNRVCLRRTDRVVGVGQAVRRALIENEAIPGRRVDVIYNGIDTQRFGGAAHRRHAAREKLQVRPGETAVIQVARLDYLKDHATALRTIERVAAQVPDVRLFLIGDGPERPKLEAEIVQRRLQSHVTLLGLRGDVDELLPGADIFLLTSISEGIPLTVIEAMAAGLPVVATDVGGVAEVVRNGESGLLAPARDDGALAAAIVRLAHDPQLRARFGNRGEMLADEMFSETQMQSSYADLYRQMLAV
jgi:L-malate glycosyltransferase